MKNLFQNFPKLQPLFQERKKIILPIVGTVMVGIFAGIIFLTNGNSSENVFASLYKIGLKNPSGGYSAENVASSTKEIEEWSERFYVYEDETSGGWKMSYPNPADTTKTDYLFFSLPEVKTMIEGVKLSKVILGKTYFFFVADFPTKGRGSPRRYNGIINHTSRRLCLARFDNFLTQLPRKMGERIVELCVP